MLSTYSCLNLAYLLYYGTHFNPGKESYARNHPSPTKKLSYHTRQFEHINNALRLQVRGQEGCAAEPSLAIIDSQSVKAANIVEQSPVRKKWNNVYNKKITGVKRHFFVDVLGLLICLVVYAANVRSCASLRWYRSVGWQSIRYILDDEWAEFMSAVQQGLANNGGKDLSGFAL